MTDHLETWQHIDSLKDELTAIRAKLAEAERALKASEQERDDVLAKFVQQSEKHRAEAAEARVKELEAKLAAVREAASGVLEWYDRDGSVGGACDPMESLRAIVREGE